MNLVVIIFRFEFLDFQMFTLYAVLVI